MNSAFSFAIRIAHARAWPSLSCWGVTQINRCSAAGHVEHGLENYASVVPSAATRRYRASLTFITNSVGIKQQLCVFMSMLYSMFHYFGSSFSCILLPPRCGKSKNSSLSILTNYHRGRLLYDPKLESLNIHRLE